MSYIRCLSNPEGLYILSTGEDIEIYQKTKKVKKLPTSIFQGLLKKALRMGNLDIPEVIRYKGVQVEYNKFGKEFKVRLQYGNWHIDMWYATWFYLVHKNAWRFE